MRFTRYSRMYKKTILFTLQTFSTTGGIQKMTRTLAHSLHRLALSNNSNFELWSVYDNNNDLMQKYLPPGNFRGFGHKRSVFFIQALKTAFKTDVIIISHINLAIVGLAIKVINPACKILLVAHGIEVWRPLSLVKRRFLKKCDKIICVSNFTRHKVIKWHPINAAKTVVLNNVIDPFMTLPSDFEKPQHLLDRYRLTTANIILFTLTRMVVTEQYKGYEQVIKVMSKLKAKFPSIKYILSGQYDVAEEKRIKQLINEYNVEEQVILTGFIEEDKLSDHFLLADLFVLPSKKEGFGIVFIEALICGLPIVCGNADGSMDAIRNGELGQAINPDDMNELENALAKYLETPLTSGMRKNLQQECFRHFNEDNYIDKLQELLIDEPWN
jgi:phosphatidylinositol alpha-1,6-mannosyltransferase